MLPPHLVTENSYHDQFSFNILHLAFTVVHSDPEHTFGYYAGRKSQPSAQHTVI